MNAIVAGFRNAQLSPGAIRSLPAVVILFDVVDARAASRPRRSQFLGDVIQTSLVTAAVADQNDMFESIRLQAIRFIFDKSFEGFRRTCIVPGD